MLEKCTIGKLLTSFLMCRDEKTCVYDRPNLVSLPANLDFILNCLQLNIGLQSECV